MFTRIARLVKSVAADTISDRALWLLIALPVAAVYLVSAHWTMNNADSVAAAAPAWTLVHMGTLHLENAHSLYINPWYMHGAHGHLVSSRMPGVIFIGVPMQAALAWSGLGAMAPSVATASLVAAAAVANMTLLLRRLSNARLAVIGGVVVAFGTAMWTVAGAELWTHGPDVLWLSAGLLALAKRRVLLAGLLFAPAAATRPHLVVVIAIVGLFVAWSRRSLWPLFQLGIPAFAGLGAVVAYNMYAFGEKTLSAGSYQYATHNAISGYAGPTTSMWHTWGTTLAGLLFSPMRGVLPYTPLVLLALVGLRESWRQLPDWARGAALGGVAYLLVQARINSADGGFGYYGSRLTLETTFLLAPLVFVSARALWVRGHRGTVFVLTATSIVTQLAGAAFGRVMTVSLAADSWHTWLPWTVVRDNGGPAFALTGMTAALIVLAAIRLVPRPRPADNPPDVSTTPHAAAHSEQLRSPMFNTTSRASAS